MFLGFAALSSLRRSLGRKRSFGTLLSQIYDRGVGAITMASSRVSGALRAFVFAALIALASAAKGVVQAGDSNFDRVVLGSGKNAFVKFLAPW